MLTLCACEPDGQAVVASPNALRCLRPPEGFAGGRYELSLSKSGLPIPRETDDPCTIFISPVVLRAYPSSLPAFAGAELLLRGAAFDLHGQYRCLFTDASGNRAESGTAEVLNTTAIRCTLQTWPYDPTRVTVALIENAHGHELSSVDGDDNLQVEAEIPPFPDGASHPQRLSVDFVEGWDVLHPTRVSSAGGSAVTIHGFGFQMDRKYYLQLGSVLEAHNQDCSCTPRSKSELFCALRRWDAAGQNARVRLFRGDERISIEGPAADSVLTIAENVEFVVPSSGSAAGGFPITVHGSGFSQTKYALKIECGGAAIVSGASTPYSHEAIIFTMPHWHRGPCDAAVSITKVGLEVSRSVLFASILFGTGLHHIECRAALMSPPS